MTTFAITKVYTSQNGKPYTPMIGEIYTLTAEFDVTGTPKNAYTVGFTMADRYVSVLVTDLAPGHKAVAADFFLPLDETIPWLVEIDPFGLADADDPTKSKVPVYFPDPHANGSSQVIFAPGIAWPQLMGTRSLKGSFTPLPPASAIDFYDPRWIVATQASFASFGPGTLDRLAIMMGIPTTESWQKLLSSTCRVQWGGSSDVFLQPSKMNEPIEYPVYLFDRKNVANADFSIIHQAVLEVRNQRAHAAKLRTVTWAQLDALEGINIFKTYASPEAVIESNHQKIGDFVTNVLGPNYRAKLTPYDAARKLFQAVLARTDYYYPAPGQPDLRPDTAVKVLDAGRGDCGGFSILLVALYRNMGFPARTACGAWVGQDAGHCWCEMYFPGHGWMVSDGAIGNGFCEDGSFAYYFGTVPDLNIRYACMRGNTFSLGPLSTSWLQGPDGPQVWGTAAATAEAHTGVADVGQSAAMSLVASATSQAMMAVRPRKPDLAVDCPCAKHGGFLPVTQEAAPVPDGRRRAVSTRFAIFPHNLARVVSL
jgi:hypothetical protein